MAGAGNWPRLGRWAPGPAGALLAVTTLGALAGVLPPLTGAALLVGSMAGLLTLIRPVYGLMLLALIIPLTPPTDRLPLAPGDALAVLVLGAVILAGLARRRLKLTLTAAFWPGILFVFATVLSALGSADPLVSAKEILRWVEVLGILIVAATICQRWQDRYLVVAALLVGLTFESLLGWGQFLLRVGPPSFRIGAFLRAYGTFGQPNPFGGYLAMTLPVAAALILWNLPSRRRERDARTKPGDPHGAPDSGSSFAQAGSIDAPAGRLESWLALLTLAAAGAGAVALLMSLSRGALLGAVGGGIVLCCFFTRRAVLLVTLGIVAVLAVVGLETMHLLPPVVSARLGQIVEYGGWFDTRSIIPNAQNWAVVERMAHWQAAWNMYLDRPIFGVGPGHYPLAYATYRVNDFWKDPLGHAHNLYLNLLAELGLVGFLAYLVQWLAWAGLLLAAWRRARQRWDRALAVGVLAGLIAIAIHNTFDNLLVHGLGTLMGMMIGLAASIGRAPATPDPARVAE